MKSKYLFLNNLNFRKSFSVGLKLLAYIVVGYSLVWWQQKDMLATGASLKVEQLSLIDIQGKSQTINFANGETNTLVYFFAPWCKICDLSIDNLEQIKQQNINQLRIIAIVLDWSSIEEVDTFLARHQLTFPILLGTTKIHQEFQIGAFPSYYLISQKAEILAKNQGYSTELGMRAILELNL